MRNMEELKMLLCDELDMIASKGELTAGSLDTIDKLTHSIKSLLAIMAMEGESYENSYRSYARGGNRGGGNRGGGNRGGRSNYGGSNYGGSYRSYARGYSRDDDIEDRLMEIMDEVDDPKVKQALQKAIEKMEG